MKRITTIVVISMMGVMVSLAQIHLGAKFIPKLTLTKPDSAFFGDIGVRGAWIGPDIDQDGKPEIFVTDYAKSGRIHAFQAKGNDTLEWIWSSPRLDTLPGLPYGAGGASTPRTIRTGDLDGDGRGEVIFPRAGAGFLVFEWDGVKGSHNFGKIPSAVIPLNVPYGPNYGALSGLPNEGGLQTTVEQFEIADVDKDGVQELITPKNVTPKDFFIISAVGQWDFESQGFASFQIEGNTYKLASTKFGGGSPYAIHPADLDGDGKMELVCHNWNYGDYFVIKVTGPDTYVLPDTNATVNGNQFYQQTYPDDHPALFGAVVADLNNDGKQEVYFPWYQASLPPGGSVGCLNVVSYNTGDNVLKADSTHSTRIATASMDINGTAISSFFTVVGDLDRNGKKELLVGSAYPSNVVAIEYKGTGAINDPASYTRKVLYTGESSIYATITYRDSLGKKDTVRTIGEGFVSKMTTPTDLDGDGRIETIIPYQSLVDSITTSWSHFRADSAKFVTDSSKVATNLKKWIFRSLEADIVGDVISKEYVVVMPDDYKLNQNYPNPFNPSTEISFFLPLDKKISVKVYDMLGREVRGLVADELYAKGTHAVQWNGRDNNGNQVASGAYICRLTTGNIDKSMKMMLLK